MDKQELLKLAKGRRQREWVELLLVGTTHPVTALKGKARTYSGSYLRSFDNLISRLEAAGVEIEKKPGPRGGYWSTTYRIVRY